MANVNRMKERDFPTADPTKLEELIVTRQVNVFSLQNFQGLKLAAIEDSWRRREIIFQEFLQQVCDAGGILFHRDDAIQNEDGYVSFPAGTRMVIGILKEPMPPVTMFLKIDE